MIEHFTLMAEYNQWMNQKLHSTCVEMGQEKVELDQNGFFGSILKTLNHLLIADTFWMYRCSDANPLKELTDEEGQPLKITGLDQILYRDIEAFFQRRLWLDNKLVEYINSLTSSDLDKVIVYRSSVGAQTARQLSVILSHWFNHQTHHRGQITTLIHQQGFDFGVTDLVFMESVVIDPNSLASSP